MDSPEPAAVPPVRDAAADRLIRNPSRARTVKEYRDLQIPTALEDLLRPASVALVVYDMQVGICRQIQEAPAITAKISKLLESARRAGVRTAFTRHMSLPKDWMGVAQFRMGMGWQRVDDPSQVQPWFLRDSSNVSIVPELQPQPSEAVFDKVTMSAFEGTPLSIALRDCGVSSVIFAGIAMEVGIEPSCRHAADLGFVPILAADACGHGNAEAASRSVEALRFSGDTVVSDAETICGILDACAPRPEAP